MTSRKQCFQVLLLCFLLCLAIALDASSAELASADGPLVLDKETGHYKDLSYEALSDEGLSWDERTSLFGGETVHYGELTDDQRAAKQKELEGLLPKIDMELVNKCEADIRKWLDQQAKNPPSSYTRNNVYTVRAAAVVLFRAYEIFDDKKYLEAGLKCADLILNTQFPKGHWGGRSAGANVIRIQDGTTTGPFWIMLYAHKLSGDKKYLDSARRAADVLLSVQSPAGGWPDQFTFGGDSWPPGGGISFNDNATNASFEIMVMMYHITKDAKDVANLGKLKAFIEKTDLGEGKVIGWAEQYYGDGRPARARGYEIELPYPRTVTRAVGPLLKWLYLMTGDEEHMDLLRKAYAWHEESRKEDLKPETWKYWKILNESWKERGVGWHYRPGWPDAWLADNSNRGRVTGYRMNNFYPVTEEMKRKYGGIVKDLGGGSRDVDKEAAEKGWLPVWIKHPEWGFSGVVHASNGNSMVEVRRALLEHKRGGHKGLLKYHTNPTKYTPDQYLQARVDAAHRALDERTVRLVADPEKKGTLSLNDPNPLPHHKGRWYGPKHSKWGAAHRTKDAYGHVAWYEWQLVYDTMLAQGKISADAAARGGRGLEPHTGMTHLDSWDVLGEWGMACHELDNYFDVPIEN